MAKLVQQTQGKYTVQWCPQTCFTASCWLLPKLEAL